MTNDAMDPVQQLLDALYAFGDERDLNVIDILMDVQEGVRGEVPNRVRKIIEDITGVPVSDSIIEELIELMSDEDED